MTHTTNHDTTALAAAEPVVPRRLVFHQIRMTVYRLAVTTTEGKLTASGRGFITRPPLLTELRDAVRPNQGGTGSGGSSPSARVAFDVGAFQLYEDITAQISSAYTTATDRQPLSTPELMLLEWFIELEATGRIKDGLSDAQLQHQLDRVHLWLQRIEDHFDPPRTGDLPSAACLECGEKSGFITVDGEDIPAPAIYWTYKPTRGLTVHCRVCDETWTGDELALRDRYQWALRRNDRIHDLTTPITPDDWHHIRLDLRESEATPKLWNQTTRHEEQER